MLEIRELSAGYPGKTVLSRVNMTVPEGKVTALLGPNGCGKSTLLKTLCGILPASSGTVTLDGQPLLSLPPGELARKVAYLAQNRQIPDITAERMVLHGLFPYLSYPRRYRKEDHEAARSAMEQMGILDLAGTPLQKLSGGQRQKVYIAMALAQNTPVVLLDEPTTYLDAAHQLQMMRQARELSARGKAVVMVLHDLSLALRTAERIAVLDQGRVIREGTPEEIYESVVLEGVFGVKLGRVQTGSGWHYYYEEA